ncbi:feruloyl-CoA synthase [Steroidobacter agaridevorans]|uniref:Feruloyl-CoA synthase n=1 Tax=Steroidobacter agaridevorans TaxID=2695856 RepID=A0A829Y926_9GAMM|nr:feruloyl-CoA synthase [Steroidobacter agaridevorans]GFE79451.1 feruloyl-CoA synthase [Steroidobacter agaridevorans]GFE88456.1 feruloyl-CoA synthase [Steroidobacter agaridevorans]
MAKDELDWTADPFHTRFEPRAGGSVLLQPQGTLPAYPARLMDWLEHWAGVAPARTLVARRVHGGGWKNVSYCEMLECVRRVAAGLATRNLSDQRPILIVSGNSIEHLVLSFAAMWAGIPFCPMSPAYSLASADLGKARYVIELLTPGMVAAFDTPSFSSTLMKLVSPDTEIVGDAPLADREVTTLAQLEAPVTSELDIRHRNTDRDTITKFLLTSGSTGQPKVVITTNRMVCSNAMMQRQSMPFLVDEPPVVVDWLPWSHTFGGSHIVGLVLSNGGTLYIDDGRPTPAGIAETIRNLREISPTVYFNVPKGFEMIAQHLRDDGELRRCFYWRLRAYFFAGASLAQHTWDALDTMSLQERRLTTPMLSGLGATETGPAVTFTTPAMGRAGVVGLPASGSLVKLAPVNEKLEIRVRSPSVTPGYWRQPLLTAEAFDDEGFYRLGDAVRLLDQNDPTRGLVFDGRIGEDFKLSNGSWVSVGPLRAELIAQLAPFVQDVVIACPDADYLTALIVPDVAACARALRLSHTPSHEEIAGDAVIKGLLRACLRVHARRNASSTRHIRRAHLLPSPPSLDHGEVTDKGSINQRAVLRNRSQLVAALYASVRRGDVIDIDEPSA